MSSLLAVTTLVDCAAVLALAWLAARAARTHAIADADQRAALERLRGELADLVAEAERRGRALDHALAEREAGLRALVEASAAAERRVVRALGDEVSDDPAERRLRREVALALGAGTGGA
jgi:hypothetical protein